MVKDILGKIIGRWTVIAREGTHKPSGCATWLCQCSCGTRKVLRSDALLKYTSKSCGCLFKEYVTNKSGSKNPNWKHGKYKTRDGYVMLRSNGKRKLEHRKIMEAHLGRVLKPEETIHHKNGKRDDNRLENLELRLKSNHGKGAAVNDLRKWAKEILDRYPTDV